MKAPRSHIKALLLEGITTSYKSPSLRMHNYFIQKPFLWKATLFITSQQLKEHCQRGNSFKCTIRGACLTSPYTQLDILFLPPVAPIFSLLSWSHHGKLPLYRWSHFAKILSVHWRYTAELQTIRDKWLCFLIFKFTLLSIWLLRI